MAIHWIIDLVLVAIIAYCAWRGWRNGIIIGVCGCAAILVSIVVGNLIGSVYAEAFSGMLEPFGSGLVDGKVSDVLHGVLDEEGNVVEILDPELKGDVFQVCSAAMRELGLADSAADNLAERVAAQHDVVGQAMSETLSTELCKTISFVMIFYIVFVLVLIVFTVIGNVLDLRFTLPGVELVNQIIGLLLGFVRGALLVMSLVYLLRYAGILLPDGALENTTVAQWMMQNNLLTDLLEI